MAEEIHITSDSLLWDSFIKGDQSAFRAIYNNNVRQLFSYGCNFTEDSGLVKDCIHDVFVDLFKYRSHLSPTGNIRLYLFKALNHCIVRNLSKRNKTNLLKTGDMPFLYTGSYEEEWIDNELFSSRARQVEKALSCLTNRQKEAIYLKFVSELSYEEISQVLDMNNQSVRNLVYRGLEKIRENCRKNGVLVLFTFFQDKYLKKE